MVCAAADRIDPAATGRMARCSRNRPAPDRHRVVAAARHAMAMSTEPQLAQAELCPISTMLIEGFVLYACAYYPTAASIEMAAQIHDRHARRDASRPHGDAMLKWRRAMKDMIHRFLGLSIVALAARIALTFPFWASGVAKLVDFDAGVAEMARVGLEPAAAFNGATIIVQLIGSLLIIANRFAWLGAGALGIFTGLTILLVHRFWAMTEEPFRTVAFHTATEHVGIIGGLIAISILSRRGDKAGRIGTAPSGPARRNTEIPEPAHSADMSCETRCPIHEAGAYRAEN